MWVHRDQHESLKPTLEQKHFVCARAGVRMCVWEKEPFNLVDSLSKIILAFYLLG